MNPDDDRLAMQAHPIPSSDPAFSAVVEDASRSAHSPAELEERLRPLYPDVRLSKSELSDAPRIWYVYRDGAFLPSADGDWWMDPAAAFVEISTTTGRVVNVNGSWAAMMGAPPDELVERHYSEFLLPEAKETANALFAAVCAHEEVRSRLLMLRPGGASIFVEFRAIRDGDVCRVHYRPVQDLD